jgi:hypothetical protein
LQVKYENKEIKINMMKCATGADRGANLVKSEAPEINTNREANRIPKIRFVFAHFYQQPINPANLTD